MNLKPESEYIAEITKLKRNLAASTKEVEWCADVLRQHLAHWKMTKSLSALPSDSQCKMLIKALERASDQDDGSLAYGNQSPQK